MRHHRPEPGDGDLGGSVPEVHPDAPARSSLPWPGSNEAQLLGCRCSTLANSIPGADALVAPDCPVHTGEQPR